MRRLRIRKVAQSEIETAFDWYRARSEVAGLRFLVAVDEAIGAVVARPDSHPVVAGALRRVLLRRFPYAVYFKIYERTISIVGVIHGRRHPQTWLRREP